MFTAAQAAQKAMVCGDRGLGVFTAAQAAQKSEAHDRYIAMTDRYQGYCGHWTSDVGCLLMANSGCSPVAASGQQKFFNS